jgi:hypothetical protein
MPRADEESNLGPRGSLQGERLGAQGAFGRQGSHLVSSKDGVGRERGAGSRFEHGHVWFDHGHVWFDRESPQFKLGRSGVPGSGLTYAETAV